MKKLSPNDVQQIAYHNEAINAILNGYSCRTLVADQTGILEGNTPLHGSSGVGSADAVKPFAKRVPKLSAQQKFNRDAAFVCSCLGINGRIYNIL